MAKKKGGGGRVTPKKQILVSYDEIAPVDPVAWWAWYEKLRANPVTIKGKRPIRVDC